LIGAISGADKLNKGYLESNQHSTHLYHIWKRMSSLICLKESKIFNLSHCS
jgi:hypothetical protein